MIVQLRWPTADEHIKDFLEYDFTTIGLGVPHFYKRVNEQQTYTCIGFQVLDNDLFLKSSTDYGINYNELDSQHVKCESCMIYK